jgi:uncharacterized RDD family membrane protein YckC
MTQQAPVQTMLWCSQCGRSFAQSDLVQIAGKLVCGGCKSAFLSRVVAGGPSAAAPSRWHYGGFWIRFCAVLIDGILLQFVRIPMSLLIVGAVANPFESFRSRVTPLAATGAMLTLAVVSMLVAFLYEVIMIRYFGATLGKMAIGVKAVRTDGSNIGWGVSIGRYFMKIVSGMILTIGYIIAGFDDEKRALHDRVCDTRVVYKRSLA